MPFPKSIELHFLKNIYFILSNSKQNCISKLLKEITSRYKTAMVGILKNKRPTSKQGNSTLLNKLGQQDEVTSPRECLLTFWYSRQMTKSYILKRVWLSSKH